MEIGKKSNLYEIQTFLNITLQKNTNAPVIILKLTVHKHLGIKTVKAENTLLYKRFYIRLENLNKNFLIKDLNNLPLTENLRQRLKRKCCRDDLI